MRTMITWGDSKVRLISWRIEIETWRKTWGEYLIISPQTMEVASCSHLTATIQPRAITVMGNLVSRHPTMGETSTAVEVVWMEACRHPITMEREGFRHPIMEEGMVVELTWASRHHSMDTVERIGVNRHQFIMGMVGRIEDSRHQITMETWACKHQITGKMLLMVIWVSKHPIRVKASLSGIKACNTLIRVHLARLVEVIITQWVVTEACRHLTIMMLEACKHLIIMTIEACRPCLRSQAIVRWKGSEIE